MARRRRNCAESNSLLARQRSARAAVDARSATARTIGATLHRAARERGQVMDFGKLIARAKNLMLNARDEWPAIAAEPATTASIYRDWILVLAAIGPIAGFIGMSLFGFTIMGVTVRSGVGIGLAQAIVGYGFALGFVFVMALVIDALAGTFGGEKNPLQALKTAAYASTAAWLFGIVQLLPALSLLALVGIGWSIYLLYIGLPHTMKCPQDRAGGYTAAVAVIWFILSLILGAIIGVMFAAGKVGGAAFSFAGANGDSAEVTVDADSALGGLAAWGKEMEKAGTQMEAAEKSGDAQAQADAMGQMMGTLMGGGGKVEALEPSVLKGFLPDTLGGMPRTSFSAERNAAMGMQISEAKASYGDGGARSLELEIIDMGSAKGLMGLASWAMVEKDQETSSGYERVRNEGGRMVHEQWNQDSNSGEYGLIVGQRFSVKVSGNGVDMDAIKDAFDDIDVDAIEAMKDQGVQKG
jgi:hypothetical protein